MHHRRRARRNLASEQLQREIVTQQVAVKAGRITANELHEEFALAVLGRTLLSRIVAARWELGRQHAGNALNVAALLRMVGEQELNSIAGHERLIEAKTQACVRGP